MTNYSIDAIKIAKAIQKDELSVLRGKEFKMRDRIKKTKGAIYHPGNETMKKPTISQRLDKLTELIELMNSRFDNLTNDVNSFKQEVNARFDRVENRLDRVENRLDKLENRLNQVENRLDYNGLKKIPENI